MNNDNKLASMNDYFKLPIFYNTKKVQLKENVIKDLELVETVDPSANSITTFFFNSANSNEFANTIGQQACLHYTTDVDFLKENQTLLQDYTKIENKYTYTDKDYKTIIDVWNEIKGDTGFKEKYHYIDWSMFEFLNKSEHFLQIMSVYNMMSPVISFFIPIIILIIHFFVIRLKGLTLTVEEYIDVLKLVASNHAIGKLFTKFNLGCIVLLQL